MPNKHLMEWFKLPEETKKNVFEQTSLSKGLSAVAIEKDWWVVHVLGIIFTSEYAEHLVFKGGTSLSKGWNLIKRFSEDIDLALSREYLGFKGDLSRKQITKLRKASCEFISTTLFELLKTQLEALGFEDTEIKIIDSTHGDDDPVKIEVLFKSHFDVNEYIKSRVLVEVGSRVLIEPFTNKEIATIISENYKNKAFADLPIVIPIVNPERTLLEKIFLLHEEFQKSIEDVNVNRMSRHHYDIVKLMETDFADIAFSDENLFNTIVAHRSTINKLNFVDYTKHAIGKLNIVPPKEIIKEWEKDYANMLESMIYGSPPNFDELMKKIEKINLIINKTPFDKKELFKTEKQ